MICRAVLVAASLSACLVAGAAFAQAPAATLRLYPGVAPGSESWRQVEKTTINPATGARMVRNVTTPTVEAYLPAPGKATGLGVLIAPGGAFRFLSWDTEGVFVARWLAERGVAGFVLKYRTTETPADDAVAFRRPASPPGAPAAPAAPRPLGPFAGSDIGIADGVRALQLVREHAREWGLSPDRIGVMGFSAGAQVTVGVVKAMAASAPPLFAAPIYGGDFGAEAAPLPGRLPPMFLAVSADDTTAGETANRLYEQLRAAGQHPEFHVFHKGGHGWGMEHHDDTADHWIEEFWWWLGSNGWLKPAPAASR